MPGILTRLINALLGEREQERRSENTGNKKAPEGLAEFKREESKEWMPDISKFKERNTLNTQAPQKPQIMQKESRTENIELKKHEGGLKYLAKNTYVKAFKPLFEKVKSHKITPFNVALAAIAIILLSFTPPLPYIKALLIIIFLILIAALSKLIQKLFPFVVGFDLCLFFTVVVGVAYHPIAGMAVGVFSSAMGSLARGQYDMDKVIVPLLGYIAVSLMLPFFPETGIFALGMIMAVIYGLLMSISFGLMWGFSPMVMLNTATFLVTSIGFDYWLFANYGASLLASIS